jgi:hypothetical protein
MTNWSSKCPKATRSARRGDPPRHGDGRRAGGEARACRSASTSAPAQLGRRALSERGKAAAPATTSPRSPGGRINFFGFLLRLAARLPFLFIAGRMYGAEALGRFAYAVLVVEFAAQLATLGLKRGLAQQLRRPTSRTSASSGTRCWRAFIASAVGMACCCSSRRRCSRTARSRAGMAAADLAVFAHRLVRRALAALAYRHDVGATVRAARSSSRGRSASPPSPGLHLQARRADHRLRPVDGRRR